MTSEQTPNDPRTAGGPLDAHLDELGSALDLGVSRAEQRRRRTRAWAGAATAAAAIGLGALVVVPGGRDLDPVAEARAAVSDGKGILHYVVRSQWRPPAGSALRPNREQPATEVWTAIEGSDRYRVRQPASGRPNYCGYMTFGALSSKTQRLARRLTGPMLVSPGDSASDGRTLTNYSAFSRAAVVRTRPKPDRVFLGGQLATPSFGTGDPRNPVLAIKTAFDSGALADGGTSTVDGRTLRRLVGRAGPTVEEFEHLQDQDYPTRRDARRRQIERGQPLLPTRYEYFVDVDTFEPVELRTRLYNVWSRAGDRKHYKWTGNIDRFEQFEQLSDTPEHRALLEIKFPEGTKVYRANRNDEFVPAINLKQAMHDTKPAIRRCQAQLKR